MDGVMNRREAREIVLHMIYSGEYSEKSPERFVKDALTLEYFESLAGEYELYRAEISEDQTDYLNRASAGVLTHGPELDTYIEKYAVGWSVSRISRVAKCVIRRSMYEILYLQIPVGASVNEALELCKRYDSPETASFVNGVLASFIANELPEQAK